MTSILQLLKDRRIEAQREIDRLRAEVRDIDTAITAIQSSGGISKTPSGKSSIDDAVVEAVKMGMKTPTSIHKYLHNELNVETSLQSVRVRASRLGQEGRLGRDKDGWALPEKNEAPGDFATEPPKSLSIGDQTGAD